MNRLTILPCLVALMVGLASMPLDIYKVCAWNAGTLRVEPWRRRTMASVRSVAQSLRAWFGALFTRRLAFACLAVLLALLVAQLGAGHEGLLLAVPPIALPELKAKRAELVREADALKSADGTFKDDATRTAFDAKMTELEGVDAQIRTAEAAPATPPAPTGPDLEAVRKAERDRISGIQQAVRLAGLEPAFAEGLVSRGVTLEAARGEIFAKLAEKDKSVPTEQRVRVELGEAERDKWLRGAANWLLHKGDAVAAVARATKEKVEAFDPGEFRGLTLLELAREALERGGVRTRGLGKMDLVGRAFTHRANITQSTSDFVVLLENVMHKMLQAAYATAPNTWSRWAARGTVSDFRPHNRYRMGMFGALDSLTETGEFKNKPINDAEKAFIQAATKGNIINVSRQMVVNDDMGAFTRLLAMLGRAAGLSVEIDAYALLLLNAGLGPTQADGQPLFHANRVNVGVGSALGVDGLDADRVLMAQQKDPWGNQFLDLRPAVLLVPIGLGGKARITNSSQYDVDVSNKFQVPNKVAGLFRDVVDTPRLSGTRRYLFAEPSEAPVFEVAFLEGQTEPVLESRDGWRVDGTEMRVRFDYGVKDVDFRGAVTNAGA